MYKTCVYSLTFQTLNTTNCRFATLEVLPRCFDTSERSQFRVGKHVTYGLKDRRIPIQYSSWSAKAINRSLGEATGHWHEAFLF